MRSAIETPKRGFLLAVLAGAALLGTLLHLPASSAAEDPCELDVNVDRSWGTACFEAEGDVHWVQDKKRNGWSVRIQIQTDYGKTRWCANTLGAPRWERCDLNHRERDNVPPDGVCEAPVAQEVRVRWRMFEQSEIKSPGREGPRQEPGAGAPTRNWTGWSEWHDTVYGGVCN